MRALVLFVALSIGAAAPAGAAGKQPLVKRIRTNMTTARQVVTNALYSGARLSEIGHGLWTVARWKITGGEAPEKPYREQVSANLTRGSRPSWKDMQRLKAEGHDAVIELTAESNADKAMAEKLGMDYLYMPIIDHTTPTFEQLLKVVEFIRAHKKSYMHCQGGMGRTGVGVAFYRMVEQGWSTERALQEAAEHGMFRENQIAAIKKLGRAVELLRSSR